MGSVEAAVWTDGVHAWKDQRLKSRLWGMLRKELVAPVAQRNNSLVKKLPIQSQLVIPGTTM